MQCNMYILLLYEVLDGPHKVNTSGIFNISEQVSFLWQDKASGLYLHAAQVGI